VKVTAFGDLPWSNIAREFVGADHDGEGVCILLVDAPPGRGPRLHRHPYDEIFLVQEGRATFFLEESERDVHAGELVVVPAGEWHGFVNSGDGPLRQVDIHVSPAFSTQWRDDPGGPPPGAVSPPTQRSDSRR
jgi:mannose-6-phosphate isomerase-like protein (cupin superfamily)